MNFRIAITFTDSLARLTAEEQKAVKTTAFDLQMNPANPGMSFHKLGQAKDPNFWSVRVNNDIRMIVHKSASSLLLCYVDHHEQAYRWAERRKLETHPTTGAAQFVEIRERVEEIRIPIYVPGHTVSPKKLVLSHLTHEDLLGYGVPAEWVEDVHAADEDTLLTLADHLPSEAAEALLELATGGKPTQPVQTPASGDPFAHPDAQRRFRVMHDVQELERALEYPWEKWTVFLHPAQRQWVEKDYSGPARVSGSAGTGKTIVALHRAVFLAKSNPDARVLLTTFSDTLAKALHTKLRRLVSNEPRLGERLEVHAMNAIGLRLYESAFGKVRLVNRNDLRKMLRAASEANQGHKFSLNFLCGEWDEIVDAWQITSWEGYRDVRRLGRKTRLPEQQRAILWQIFEAVRSQMAQNGLMTIDQIFAALTEHMAERKRPPFDYTVVDEAQDIGIQQMRFLAAMGQGNPNGLFFAGDMGQRIFQQPFSWKALGVDIRGRSRTLSVNYRTSHQIRTKADRLLGPEVSDADGNTDRRTGTVSVFNGPPPTIKVFDTQEDEGQFVGAWLVKLRDSGLALHEMGIFVRSEDELDRARTALDRANLAYVVLDENVSTEPNRVSVSVMHLAKGLEFRAVSVMACDDEIIPSQMRINSMMDDSDLEEVYNTERHLLYVACTRARDHLLVTSTDPSSEFLDDLNYD
jgi:mRNA-degrading endonuclease RelE of RelBE toxin-antitoxin system